MKIVLAFTLALACAASAFARPLPPLQPPEFADTEVTAHCLLGLPRSNMTGLNLEISFTGTSSNNVEIVLGRDDDGDGELSFDESAIRIGWDCGRYFVERVVTGERFEESPAGADGTARLLRWNCAVRRRVMTGLSVASEAGTAFADLMTAPPRWLYDPNWDLMRLTARGPDARDERFDVEVATRGIAVILSGNLETS